MSEGICENCGHRSRSHVVGIGACEHYSVLQGTCSCKEFEPSIKSKVQNLPIPEALYSCHYCREERSWPSQDLHWYPEVKHWVCIECGDDVATGKAGISLKDEIARQNT